MYLESGSAYEGIVLDTSVAETKHLHVQASRSISEHSSQTMV